jgi:hypothetical protein
MPRYALNTRHDRYQDMRDIKLVLEELSRDASQRDRASMSDTSPGRVRVAPRSSEKSRATGVDSE